MTGAHTRVTIDDVEFRCHGPVGTLIISTMSRWDGAVSTTASTVERHPLPGDQVMEIKDSTLALSMTGWADCVTRDQMRELRDRLASLRGRLVLMTVDEGRFPTQRLVRVASVECPEERGMETFEWSIDLVAHDPRRYAPAVEYPAGTAIHNDGTAPTSPVITLAGPSNTSSVYCQRPDGTQDSWFSVAALKAGEVLRVDCDSGVVTLNGLPSFAVRHPQFPVIPPGETRYFTADSGVLAVEFRSAWW